MPEREVASSPGGRVMILDAGQATLELADVSHATYIDQLEVGIRVAGHIRVALQVDEVDAATNRAGMAGAVVIAEPTPTPWGSRNARLSAPGGLQLTLFGA
jgi:lactoylglutathione lyase